MSYIIYFLEAISYFLINGVNLLHYISGQMERMKSKLPFLETSQGKGQFFSILQFELISSLKYYSSRESLEWMSTKVK